MTPLNLFKCLADATRLKLVLLIAQRGELCVCELTTALDVSQPKVSRHLAQLRNCSVLVARREGQWMHYSINPELPAWAREVIVTTADNGNELLTECCQRLGQAPAGPQRSSDPCAGIA